MKRKALSLLLILALLVGVCMPIPMAPQVFAEAYHPETIADMEGVTVDPIFEDLPAEENDHLVNGCDAAETGECFADSRFEEDPAAGLEGQDESTNEFSQEEWDTFTNGFYTNGELLFGLELSDYLFSGLLDDRAFKLAVNQMTIDQAGSLEGLLNDEQGLILANAMVHGGFRVDDPTGGYAMPLSITGAKMTAAAPVWPEEGAIKLDKDAQAVEGQNNLWEVTVGIQGKNYATTSDVVLVIDTSGSMSGTKMANTKKAAKAFADKLLTEGSATRIAIVTYSNSASSNGIFYTYATKANFNTAIDAMRADGGTNQQAGLDLADDILYSPASTGILKNIVILSDGEPTYSYLLTGTARFTGCTYILGHVNIFGSVDASTVSITGCDYNTVVGYGNAYSTTNNIFLNLSCQHNENWTKRDTFGGNHGVATIWEANQIKAKGTTIYSVALQAGTNGETVLTACATDPTKNYFAIGENDNVEDKLTDAFDSIAGRIAIAASGGAVTDPMGEKVQLNFSGTPVITTDLAAYNAGNAHVYISQGSAFYNTADRTIHWTVGNVNEGDNPVMKYKIGIKDGVTVNTGEVIDTNRTTTFSYKDYQQNQTSADFPIPQVTVGGGNILVHWYRVNEAGQPVNIDGTVVPSPGLAYQLAPAAYFEYSGSTGLIYNTPYTVNKRDFTDTDFVYFGQYNLNGGALTVGESAVVTLTAANSNQHIWFAYVLEETCTLKITKNGAEPIDENQSFVFHIQGTDGKTSGVALTAVIHGNSYVTLTGLPKGSYQVTEDSGWSWRYVADSTVKEISIVPKAENTLSFSNTRAAGPAGSGWKWLNGCAWIDNRWMDGEAVTPAAGN